jgi:AcrR family transcriptional regulator
MVNTTRPDIVDAAIAEFTTTGFARSSLDRIATAAGVTKGAVYHHFTDKETLFEVAFLTVEARFADRIFAAVEDVHDPRALLAAGIDLLLLECIDPVYRSIAILQAPGVLGWSRWREIERSGFLGLARAVLDALSGSGSLTVPAGDLSARLLLAATTEAGCGLSATADARSPAARHQLATQILAMIGLAGT